MTISVLIADDHPLVRQSLRRLLNREPDMGSRSTGADRQRVEHALMDRDIDVVILNSGLKADAAWCRQLIRRLPRVKLIVMSLHTDHHYVDQRLRTGADGYVVKSSAYEDLPEAVRCVSRGQRYISREIAGGPECRPTGLA